MNQQNMPKAFISCSLRSEDRAFVSFIVRLTRSFGFQPVGTVGKFAAAPQPIWQQMNMGIKNADCLVLAATPRYIQQDIHDKQRTGKGISEMLHVEIGMAIMSNRPVLAFVQKGTHVGGFLPQLVQYIDLDSTDQQDIRSKWPLIVNYFRSALVMIQQRRGEQNREDFLKSIGIVLGLIGGVTVVDSLFGNPSSTEEAYRSD